MSPKDNNNGSRAPGFLAQTAAVVHRNNLLTIRNFRLAPYSILLPQIYIGVLLALSAALPWVRYQPQPGLSAAEIVQIEALKSNTSVSPPVQTTKLLAFAPDTSLLVQSVMEDIVNPTKCVSCYFANWQLLPLADDEAINRLAAETGNISAAVFFNLSLTSSDVMVAGTPVYASIRFPTGLFPSSTNLKADNRQPWCRVNATSKSSSSPYALPQDCLPVVYAYSGFLHLQTDVAAALATHLNNSFPAANQTSWSPLMSLLGLPSLVGTMPFPAYASSPVYLSTMNAIYVVLSYWPYISAIITAIVTDKEKRLKEGMNVMGLTDAAFFASWLVTFGVIGVLLSLITSIMLVAGNVLPHANFFLVWFALFLYAATAVGFSLGLTPFFEKARVASLAGTLISVTLSVIYYPVADVAPNAVGMWLLSLLAPVALSFLIGQASILEYQGTGLTGETLWSPVIVDGYTPGASLIMLAIDIPLYLFLAWYLENVVPRTYGPSRSPWFLCTRAYWFRPRVVDGHANAGSNESGIGADGSVQDVDVEPLLPSERVLVALVVRNLRKEYPRPDRLSGSRTTVALDGVSLDLMEGEIFGLLGHNGAGKTTLMSILAGSLRASSGSATAFGVDVSRGSRALRTSMGFCPQHDLIFDKLTAREHLALFAGIKGARAGILIESRDDANTHHENSNARRSCGRAYTEEVNAAVNEVLELLGISDIADSQVSTLSGGQKRKVSVGAALIGAPRLVLLDEPSAGVDVNSRRMMWQALQRCKAKRIIVVTSHLVEEIDALTDRKAILSHGRVRCCGTSIFLKTRLGLGYRVDVSVEDAPSTLSIVTSEIPQATREAFATSGGARGATIRIPPGSENLLSRALKRLDTELPTVSYSVGVASLEDVFLKLENDDNISARGGQHTSRGPNIDGYDSVPLLSPGENSWSLEPISTNPSPLRTQFRALTYYKFRQMLRRPFHWFTAPVLAIIVMVIGVVVSVVSNTGTQAQAATANNMINVPGALVLDASAIGYTGSSQPPPIPLWVDPALGTDSTVQLAVASLQFPVAAMNATNSKSFVASLINSSAPAGLLFESDPTNPSQPGVFGLRLDPTVTHASPATWGMSVSAWASALGLANPLIFVEQPLPTPQPAYTFNGSSFVLVLLVGTALILVPGNYSVETVRDRSKGIRHQLEIMGMEPYLYWAACFARDFTVVAFVAVVGFILVAAVQPACLSGYSLLPLSFTFILFPPMAVIFAYLLGTRFTEPDSFLLVTNMLSLMAMIPYIVVSTLDQFGLSNVAVILHFVFMTVLPPYDFIGTIDAICLVTATSGPNPSLSALFSFTSSRVSGSLLIIIGQLIVNTSLLVMMEIVNQKRRLEAISGRSETHHTASFRPITLRIIEFVVKQCIRILGILLNALLAHRKKPSNDSPIHTAEVQMDEDVANEKRRIQSARANGVEQDVGNNELAVEVRGLTKTYMKAHGGSFLKRSPPTLYYAVDDLWFGVEKGECFGLLGPNGAGKTQTLSMMTGQINPTSGSIRVAGIDTSSIEGRREAFRALGYCPQFDAQFDDLTPREHLDLYCRIKGVPEELRESRIEAALGLIDLAEHGNKVSRNLSGGSRRKLSFCIALIGSPSLLILDEPSTGMDPAARRKMWGLIVSNIRDRSCILTTHSMDEADALSTRLGIMVKGKLCAIGTSEHIKRRFGQGYRLEVSAHTDRAQWREELKGLVDKAFPENEYVNEPLEGRLTYKVKVPENKLGTAFEEIQRWQQHGIVRDAVLGQTTLEHVFVDVVRNAHVQG